MVDDSDISWHPENEKISSDEEMSEPEPILREDDRCFIVYENQLNVLFSFCYKCGSPTVHVEKFLCGSMVCVKTECTNNCSLKWYSQSTIRKMPVGNLLLAGSILFTGNQYDKMAEFASVLNLSFISRTSYYKIQDVYMFPVINKEYEMQQAALLSAFGSDELFVCGDGQCDSPGHCAKYLTYTLMEEETSIILSSHVVSVDETKMNSYAMELRGFTECLAILEDHGINVTGIATDRHVQIAAFMKHERPDLMHQFDVFHVAKSITKSLRQVAQKKSNEQLLPWIQSVSNHLWWSCKTCQGDELV